MASRGVTALTALAVIGCSGTGPGGAASPDPMHPDAYVLDTRGIEVLDSTGTAMSHPWLGGLNLPRPQLVDIDGDDDLDLFAQEYSDQLMFFENVGTPTAHRFEYRTGDYLGIRIGEWYRFADMDGDGDADLLAEHPFSYIRYYRNDGSVTAPMFVLVADSLKDAAGEPIFSDRQNIPQVTDIDCNGRLDLFIGRITGTVVRYEEVGRDANAVPRFRLVTERFENIEIVNQVVGSMHGANTMSFVDIDRDGDQDLFWGDFFEPGLLFLENTGTCEVPSLRGEPVPFPRNAPIETSGYNASAFGDLDRDGDLDLLIGVLGGAYNPARTSVDNFHWLEAEGPMTFTDRTSRLITAIDEGSESIPVLVDLDADGDLDLLVSNKIDQTSSQTGHVAHFENIGTATAPRFHHRGALPALQGAFHYAPTFADLDGDGDLDMLVGNWRANLLLYENTGGATPRFTLADSAFVTLTRGSNATPALVDIDADGDVDLFAGESSGALNFWRNEGTPTAPDFQLVDDEYLGIDAGRRSVPTFADLDGDGDYDLALGSESSGMLTYRNVGSPQTPEFVPDSSLSLPIPPFGTPVFADIDADGDLDLFTGGVGGGVMFYRHRP